MPSRSNDEAKEIEKWLSRYDFKPTKSACDQLSETVWVRGCCQMQVRRAEAASYSVNIRSSADSEWRNLDQVVSQLDKTDHRLVRAPIEIAVSHFLGFEVSERRSPGARLYAACQPWAYAIKIALQMVIGIGAIVALCWALIRAQGSYHGLNTWKSATDLSIGIITAALSAAGAVELAYTLYTPGPDEALDPLMLGLSAGILLVITRSDIAVGWQFTGVILGIISLWALFRIRQQFIDSGEHNLSVETEISNSVIWQFISGMAHGDNLGWMARAVCAHAAELCKVLRDIYWCDIRPISRWHATI
jgi:hypothetical protein